MTDFWDRKKQELIQKGELQAPRRQLMPRTNGPWWLDIEQQASNITQQDELPLPGIIDGHDVSKAAHIKSESSCPMCGAGGPGKEKLPGIMKPNPSSAARCGSCGYIEGRQINDTGVISSAIVSGIDTKTIRQTPDGGGSGKNRTHLGSTKEEILYNSALLEQSLQGNR